MAVVKIIELVGSSTESSDAAVQAALSDAKQTLRNIKAVDVVSTGLRGENVDEWRAHVRVAFLIERVSDHGRVDATGERYGRQARIVAVTTHESEIASLRAGAKALIERGSSDWIASQSSRSGDRALAPRGVQRLAHRRR